MFVCLDDTISSAKVNIAVLLFVDTHLIYFRSLQERSLNNAVSIYSTRETEKTEWRTEIFDYLHLSVYCLYDIVMRNERKSTIIPI